MLPTLELLGFDFFAAHVPNRSKNLHSVLRVIETLRVKTLRLDHWRRFDVESAPYIQVAGLRQLDIAWPMVDSLIDDTDVKNMRVSPI